MDKFTFKIVVCGDYAVGKTSLLNRYIDARFTADYLPTLGVNMLRKEMERNKNKVKLMFWDIAGQELFAQVREQFYQGTQGAMLVYDVTRPESFANIPKWYNEIVEGNKEIVHCLFWPQGWSSPEPPIEYQFKTKNGKIISWHGKYR